MPASSNASTASLLLLLQLGSRLVTFALNQALLSFTTPAAFGTATIQLEPLLNTVLFLTREGIRNALLRTKGTQTSEGSIARISLIPLGLGIPLSLTAFSYYARHTSAAVHLQPFFSPAVLLYGLATCIELAAEPYFNRAQVAQNVRLRVAIEGSAVIGRAVATLAVILYGRDRLALLAFAVGQCTYSVIMLLRYWWHFDRAIAHSTTSGFDRPTLELAFALTKQSFFKQALTEGDKLIVSRISPIQDQGGYGLALNYGSLIARIVFQPLEESSRMFYSQTVASHIGTDAKPVKDSSKRNVTEGINLLKRLLALQSYLGIVFVCFCPFYTTPLLYHVLRGSRWMSTSAPALLQRYLFLLPLLGFNGVLEAFVQAVATQKQLGNMSWALLVFSGIYCLSTYILVAILGMKEEALIYANGIAMLCRIVYSTFFIRSFTEHQGVRAEITKSLLQAKWTVLSAFAMTPLLRWSANNLNWRLLTGLCQHVAIGIACFVPCACIGLYSERNAVKALAARLQKAKTT